jgi:hypothetical protein
LDRFEPNILPTLRPGTARNYQSLIRHDLLPFFGRMRLPEIGPMEVQMFLTGKSKQVAAGTVLTLRNRLSKIFGTAVKWGYLQSNPTQGAQVPALTDTKERVALTPEQARALLAELFEPFRTMVSPGGAVRVAAGGAAGAALETREFPRTLDHRGRVGLHEAECSSQDQGIAAEGVH